MRTLALGLAMFAAGCSSSSATVPDGGHEKDAHASADAPHHAGDAGPVCSRGPVDSGGTSDAAVESGKTPDGAVESGPHREAGADAAARDGGTDAATPCATRCMMEDPAAYETFQGYVLTDCGCVATGACYSNCHASATRDPASPCGACLGTQEAEGLSSTCALAAAADCSNDTACAAYQMCAGACPM